MKNIKKTPTTYYNCLFAHIWFYVTLLAQQRLNTTYIGLVHMFYFRFGHKNHINTKKDVLLASLKRVSLYEEKEKIHVSFGWDYNLFSPSYIWVWVKVSRSLKHMKTIRWLIRAYFSNKMFIIQWQYITSCWFFLSQPSCCRYQRAFL